MLYRKRKGKRVVALARDDDSSDQEELHDEVLNAWSSTAGCRSCLSLTRSPSRSSQVMMCLGPFTLWKRIGRKAQEVTMCTSLTPRLMDNVIN